MNSRSRSSQKSRRCYHRVISGLERGGNFRFLTLTSSNESPDTCQHSWRALYMRLQRRGLAQAYIKVPELSKNGKQHLHVILRGNYIDQVYLSHVWQEIHKAKVVGITRVKKGQGRRGLANYLVKYMTKDNFFRYSWSWSWVWRGFCKHWTRFKRTFRYHQALGIRSTFQDILYVWRHFLKLKHPSPLLHFLAEWEPSAKEYASMALT